MKKVLISVLLVLLTLCLFVSCSDEKDVSVTFRRIEPTTGKPIDYVFSNNGKVVCESINTTYNFEDTLNFYNGVIDFKFYKDEDKTEKIKTFDELLDNMK